MLDFLIETKAVEIAAAVNKYNEQQGNAKRIDADDVTFDDSRAWSLSVPGSCMDLGCNRFGAYRAYLGGGVRGSIEHNGRDQDGTTELGNLFAAALREIEDAYNQEWTPEATESWETATGVLL